MNNRQRMSAVLNYETYDAMPVVHFGYWGETLQKWVDEGHLKQDEIAGWGDGNDVDKRLSAKLGFDLDYLCAVGAHSNLMPWFESRLIRTLDDGSRHVLNHEGMIVLQREGAGSIPAEVDHLLKDREVWEQEYKPRLQFSPDRVNIPEDLKSFLEDPDRSDWIGLNCGSLFGIIRNWLGVQGLSYLYADDEELFKEIVDTVGELAYRGVEAVLERTTAFDFAHFWEDICFRSGPLVSPRVFEEYVGPHYKRITQLVNKHGINIVSLDCDGKIDALVPIWVKNGVNTMFPIEVGTWDATIAPWRESHGRELRGVGGMNKVAFSRDRKAIDEEIERLKPLVDLGGFVPCPDHRIAPDAVWENVQYYCDKVRATF